MLLISVQYNDAILRFKAPRGLQYFIESISMVNQTAINNILVMVIDFLAEDEQTDSFNRSSPSIANMITTIGGLHTFINSINHKTKFISIGKNSTAGVTTFINIYGKLIPISRTDTLLEWFRKGS